MRNMRRVNHTIIVTPIGVDGVIVYDDKRHMGALPSGQMHNIAIMASFSRNRNTITTIPSKPLVPGLNEPYSLLLNNGGIRYLSQWDDNIDNFEKDIILQTNLHQSKRNRRLEPKQYEVVVGLKRGDKTVVLGVSMLNVYGPQEDMEMELPLCPVGFKDVQEFNREFHNGEDSVGVQSLNLNPIGVAWDVDQVAFAEDQSIGYVLAKNASFKIRIEVVDTMSFHQQTRNKLKQMQSNSPIGKSLRSVENMPNVKYNEYTPDDGYGRDCGDGISEISSVSGLKGAYGKSKSWNTISGGNRNVIPGRRDAPGTLRFNHPQINDSSIFVPSHHTKNTPSFYSVYNTSMRQQDNFTAGASRFEEQRETYDDFSIGRSEDKPAFDATMYNEFTFSKDDEEETYDNNGMISNIGRHHPNIVGGANRFQTNDFFYRTGSGDSQYLYGQPYDATLRYNSKSPPGNGFMNANGAIQPQNAPFMHDPSVDPNYHQNPDECAETNDPSVDPNYLHNHDEYAVTHTQTDDNMVNIKIHSRGWSRSINEKQGDIVLDQSSDGTESIDSKEGETPLTRFISGLFSFKNQELSHSKKKPSDGSSSGNSDGDSSSSESVEAGPLPQAVTTGTMSLGGQSEITNFSQDSWEEWEKPSFLSAAFGGNGMIQPSSHQRFVTSVPSRDEYKSIGNVMSSHSLYDQRRKSHRATPQTESGDDDNYIRDEGLAIRRRKSVKQVKSSRSSLHHQQRNSSRAPPQVESRDDDYGR